LPVESVKCPVCKTLQSAKQDRFGKDKRVNVAGGDEKIPKSLSNVDAGASNPELNSLSQNRNTLQANKPQNN